MPGRENRAFSILIVPEDGSSTLEFRITQRAIHALKITSFVLLGLLLVAGGCYWWTVKRAAMALRLERENLRLSQENQKVRELSETLQQVSVFRRRLMAMLGEGMSQEGETEAASEDGGSSLARVPSSPGIGEGEEGTPQEWGRWRPLLRPMDGRVVRTVDGPEDSLCFKRRGRGIDIASESTPLVWATAEGTVTFAGWNEELGALVVLNHGGKYSTWYSGDLRFLVQEGEWVQMGQAVALLEGEENSLLHYEVWQGDRMRNPGEFFVL